MQKLLLSFFPVAFVGLLPRASLAQRIVPLDPKDIEFKAQQLGGPALPYQAVRLRFTLRNVSNKQLGPLASIGGNCFGIKGPADKDHQGQGPLIIYERFEHRGISVPTASEHLNAEHTIVLNPGKQTALSIAFGRWCDENFKHQVAFPVPGTYSLKCGYAVDALKGQRVYDVVEVKVQEPKGADKLIYELLKKDPALAADLLQPNLNRPHEGTYAKVKKLIEDVKKSSYLPYARLALARCYLTTKVPGITSVRVAEALAADELEKAAELRYDPETKQFYPDDFPFRPQALALLANLADRNRPNYLLYLHRDHKDSLQWINEFARLLYHTSAPRVGSDLQRLIEGDFPKGAPAGDIWRWFRTQ